MSEIERLRALLAEATPGPWKADETTDQFTDFFEEDERPDRTGWFRECGVGEVDTGDYSTLTFADAALIAAAVNALPVLLDVAEAADRCLEWGDVGGLLTGDVGALRAALARLDGAS